MVIDYVEIAQSVHSGEESANVSSSCGWGVVTVLLLLLLLLFPSGLTTQENGLM